MVYPDPLFEEDWAVDSRLETGGDAPGDAPPGDDAPAAVDLTTAIASWTEALRSVQKSIDDAAEAIRFLRRTMQEMAPLWRSLTNLEDALRGQGLPQPSPETAAEAPRPTAPIPPPSVFGDEGAETRPKAVFGAGGGRAAPTAEEADTRWESFRRRSEEKREPAPKEQPVEVAEPVAIEPRAALKPVTLVPDDTIAPYTYRMTVEEPGRPVQLVPLHQALNSVASIRNMSLIGYLNGVASLAIESTDEITPAEIEQAISRTMQQECSVINHDESTLLVQIGEKPRGRKRGQ